MNNRLNSGILQNLLIFHHDPLNIIIPNFPPGITYSADCFAYCVMAHLLWPTRSEQYFLLAGPSSAELEELDEFNEAPHVVNNSYTSLSSMSSLDICRFDDPPKDKVTA